MNEMFQDLILYLKLTPGLDAKATIASNIPHLSI